MMVVMMVMVLMVVIIVIVIVIVVMMVMMVLVVFIIVIIVFLYITVMILNFLNPGSRSSHFIEVEHVGIQQSVKVYVAVVTLYDLGLGLNGTDNLTDSSQLMRRYLRSLVQQDDVAELNLLDNKILNIILLEVGAKEVAAVAKLIAHAQCVYYCCYAIHYRHTFADIFQAHGGNRANGLRYRSWLTNSAGFYHYIVKPLLAGDVTQLLY